MANALQNCLSHFATVYPSVLSSPSPQLAPFHLMQTSLSESFRPCPQFVKKHACGIQCKAYVRGQFRAKYSCLNPVFEDGRSKNHKNLLALSSNIRPHLDVALQLKIDRRSESQFPSCHVNRNFKFPVGILIIWRQRQINTCTVPKGFLKCTQPKIYVALEVNISRRFLKDSFRCGGISLRTAV